MIGYVTFYLLQVHFFQDHMLSRPLDEKKCLSSADENVHRTMTKCLTSLLACTAGMSKEDRGPRGPDADIPDVQQSQ